MTTSGAAPVEARVAGDDGLAVRLVPAMATRDRDVLHRLLDPGLRFRGLTPHRFWAADSADDFIDTVLAR